MKRVVTAIAVCASLAMGFGASAAEQQQAAEERPAVQCPHCGKNIDRAQLRNSLRELRTEKDAGAAPGRMGPRGFRAGPHPQAWRHMKKFQAPGARRNAPGALFRQQHGRSFGQPGQWRQMPRDFQRWNQPGNFGQQRFGPEQQGPGQHGPRHLRMRKHGPAGPGAMRAPQQPPPNQVQ